MQYIFKVFLNSFSVRFTFGQDMEPETSAEETLEEDVRLNESFYIIRPHSDSELAQCHGFNLKKDFEVRTVVFQPNLRKKVIVVHKLL